MCTYFKQKVVLNDSLQGIVQLLSLLVQHQSVSIAGRK